MYHHRRVPYLPGVEVSFDNRHKKQIGFFIRAARKIKGLTADQVADRCNVSRSRVYQWEQQAYVLPKNLKPLSGALQIPVKTLEAENGPRPPKKI